MTHPHTLTIHRVIEDDRDLLPECFLLLELVDILLCCTRVSHAWNRIIKAQPKRIFTALYRIKRCRSVCMPMAYQPLTRRIHLDLPPHRHLLQITPTHSDLSLRNFTGLTSIMVGAYAGRRIKDVPTLFDLLPDTTKLPSSASPNDDDTASPDEVVIQPSSTTTGPETSAPAPSSILSLHLLAQEVFVANLLSHPCLKLLQELTLNDSLSLEDVTTIGTLRHLNKLVCTQPVHSDFYLMIHDLPSLTALGIETLFAFKSYEEVNEIDPLPSQLVHLWIPCSQPNSNMRSTLPIPFTPLSSLTQLETFECSQGMADEEAIQNLTSMVAWLSQLTTLLSIDLHLSCSDEQVLPLQVLNYLTPLVCHNNSQLVVSELVYGGMQWSSQKISFRRGNYATSLDHTKSVTPTASNVSASPPTSITGLLDSWRPTSTQLLHLTLVHLPLSMEFVQSLKVQPFPSLRSFSFSIGFGDINQDPQLFPSEDMIIQFFQFIGQQVSLVKLDLDLTRMNQFNSVLLPALCHHCLVHLVALEELTLKPAGDRPPYEDRPRLSPLLIQTLLKLTHLKQLNYREDVAFFQANEIEQLKQAGVKFPQESRNESDSWDY